MPHKRSNSLVNIQIPESLSSHNPMTFSSMPKPQVTVHIPSLRYTATRLQCISNYKLRLEASRQEPRLGNLLGHIAIYDNVREWRKEQALQEMAIVGTRSEAQQVARPATGVEVESSQKNTSSCPHRRQRQDREEQTKSFADFQAAIQVQIATMERIKAAAEDLRRMTSEEDAEDDYQSSDTEVEEYESSSETDSDYDSYDGDGGWRDDDDDGAESEDSMTDPESVRSECSSPVEDDVRDGDRDYFDVSLNSSKDGCTTLMA